VAVARAAAFGSKVVVLDEPTAALGVRESAQVLEVIRDLRKHDVAVIVVTHNMQQLMEVADRVTVMRLGRTIATRRVAETDVSEVVGLITGAVAGDFGEEDRRAEAAA
jgi:ABC-type sugar transport system ATPase subunit